MSLVFISILSLSCWWYHPFPCVIQVGVQPLWSAGEWWLSHSTSTNIRKLFVTVKSCSKFSLYVLLQSLPTCFLGIPYSYQIFQSSLILHIGLWSYATKYFPFIASVILTFQVRFDERRQLPTCTVHSGKAEYAVVCFKQYCNLSVEHNTVVNAYLPC
jgi:hypothetical protein